MLVQGQVTIVEMMLGVVVAVVVEWTDVNRVVVVVQTGSTHAARADVPQVEPAVGAHQGARVAGQAGIDALVATPLGDHLVVVLRAAVGLVVWVLSPVWQWGVHVEDIVLGHGGLRRCHRPTFAFTGRAESDEPEAEEDSGEDKGDASDDPQGDGQVAVHVPGGAGVVLSVQTVNVCRPPSSRGERVLLTLTKVSWQRERKLYLETREILSLGRWIASLFQIVKKNNMLVHP